MTDDDQPSSNGGESDLDRRFRFDSDSSSIESVVCRKRPPTTRVVRRKELGVFVFWGRNHEIRSDWTSLRAALFYNALDAATIVAIVYPLVLWVDRCR